MSASGISLGPLPKARIKQTQGRGLGSSRRLKTGVCARPPKRMHEDYNNVANNSLVHCI